MRSRSRMRSSRYKPLVSRRTKHRIVKTRRTKKVQKLPNINPSVRVIWKIMTDGRVLYKGDVIGDFTEENDDNTLNLRTAVSSLVQELDYSYEQVLEFFRFFPSLFAICKSKSIKIIDIPNIPNQQEYKNLKEGEDY